MADNSKTDVPENANQAAGLVAQRMAGVKHKLLVLSGKGGVGKSTVSAQLAFSLAHRGYSVGLLDVDICGPSIPRMLGLSGQEVHQSATGWSPVFVDDNLGVMSIGFMLPGSDDAIIWRGPRKNGLIKQFLTDVEWGELDFLIIDTPPGTSDEHISIVQYLREAGVDGAVVVSTPQEVAMADVRKELNFCRKTKTPVVGVVENMGRSSIAIGDLKFSADDGSDATEAVLARIKASCSDLLTTKVALDMFPSYQGGVQAMATAFGTPFLGRVPLDPGLTQACEEGRSYAEDGTGPGAAALKEIVNGVVEQVGAGPPPETGDDE